MLHGTGAPLTLSRWHKTSIILLWLTPDDFTRQGESSRLERVKVFLFIKFSGRGANFCQRSKLLAFHFIFVIVEDAFIRDSLES